MNIAFLGFNIKSEISAELIHSVSLEADARQNVDQCIVRDGHRAAIMTAVIEHVRPTLLCR